MTPVYTFVAWSGTGKTSYLERLIAELSARGVRVGTIKHDAHEFEIDKPGKDSWRFARAGAQVVAVASKTKCAVMGVYKRTGGNAAEAIRAGASYGQTATAQAAAKNPNAMRWGIGKQYYWQNFYKTPDASERSAVDKYFDALAAQSGQPSGRGLSTYQQYVKDWQDFLASIGCGLDVQG